MTDSVNATERIEPYFPHRTYVASLDFPRQCELAEASCRRCAVERGLSPDWRCHGNCSPIECWCTSLDEEIAARLEAKALHDDDVRMTEVGE